MVLEARDSIDDTHEFEELEVDCFEKLKYKRIKHLNDEYIVNKCHSVL